MIQTASGTADAMRDSPEAFFAAARDLAMPVSIAVALVVLVGGLAIGQRFGWYRRKTLRGPP